MTLRILAALPPLLLAAVGCVDESRHAQLAPPGEPMRSTSLRAVFGGPRLPEHDAGVKRLVAVRGKLVAANPQSGVRPNVGAVGLAHPEVCHTGGGTSGYQIVVTDALIAACKTDDELAAVLAIEMGKIVAERSREARTESRLPPDPNLVGGSDGGSFGPPDGTRQMELARYAPKRAEAAASPEELARSYLGKAGYDVNAASAVAPLLRKAQGHADLDRILTTSAQIGPPVKAAPAPAAK